jgi:uncharacterized ferritin-like protein (DUF455 family)
MKNLYTEAKKCFLTRDPDEKLTLSQDIVAAWVGGQLEWKDGDVPLQLVIPGRLDKPVLVPPNKVKKRGFRSIQQRAGLIHALTHIELTAVNLCWDSVYRYRHMPKAYYDDWINTAKEETLHFFALRSRLRDIGYEYGDLPVHDELWQMAVKTSDDLMARMAIVHRVLEARALDVVPLSEARFREIADKETADVLVMIANDEIGHVNAGARWYRYCCEQQQLDPDTMFFHLLEKYLQSTPRGPFNREARMKAGFSLAEMQKLEQLDAAFKTRVKAKVKTRTS